MDKVTSLAQIIDHDGPLEEESMLHLIIPFKTTSSYTLNEVDHLLKDFHDEIESIQRDSNDKFDEILDDPLRSKLRNLSKDLDKTLSKVNKLHGNIEQARKQFELVKKICDDKIVHERRNLLTVEARLQKELQQAKFSIVKEFFDYFLAHMEISITASRNQMIRNSASYSPSFDWANYHRIIFLLRACGQAIRDLETFELIYQTFKNIYGLSLKQPVNQMDLNKFIEFYASYTLDTQVEVILNDQSETCELRKFIGEQEQVLQRAAKNLNFELFTKQYDKMVAITTDCCRLLVELNTSYIESHLTDGISIDKLNGGDSFSTTQLAEILPYYAFSPQDYITQIGQYLFTLKKQTEKFDQVDNKPLKLSLLYFEKVVSFHLNVKLEESAADIILRFVSRQIIRSLVGRTTASILSQLNANGQKQIATDAMYLDNVLEDLNLLDTNDPFVAKFKKLFSQ